MQWYQWLIYSPHAISLLREIDRQLENLFLLSVTSSEASRTRLSHLVVQMLFEMIPDYDLRRGFFAQFVTYAIDRRPHMLQLGNKLNEMHRAAVDGQDIELEILFGLLKSFTLLFALETRSGYALQLRSEIFNSRSRSMNDLIQHFLATKLNELAADREPVVGENFFGHRE